jgi:hypothetical protein
MMQRLMETLAGAGIALCVCSAPLLAAGPDKEGKYDHEECWSGTHHMIVHSDNAMGGAFHVHGITPGAKPGNLYNNIAGLCVGSWTLVNGQYNESSACEYKDPSGDKFFGMASRKNDEEGYFQVIGGTGKYAGMTHTSRWKPITDSPQPDGTTLVCLRDRGTWKLR